MNCMPRATTRNTWHPHHNLLCRLLYGIEELRTFSRFRTRRCCAPLRASLPRHAGAAPHYPIAELGLVQPTSRYMNQPSLIFISCLAYFVAHVASASDPRIVPGQQIGNALLAATRERIHEVLGEPHETVRLDTGIVREDWLSKDIAPKSYVEAGLYFKHDFLTVYFRDDHVIQIEVSSATFKTPEGLCTASGAGKFRERYSDFTRIHPPHFRNPDPGGCPAPKHFVAYEDAVSAGVAWRFGAWGGLAPEPDPRRLEIVIVHRRGEPVFVDPDGGTRLVWKLPPHQLMENYPTK